MLKDRQVEYIFLSFFLNNRSKRYVTANIIDWAYKKLVKEEETTYICYLAGFTLKEAEEKIDTFWWYFEKALQELDITIPSLSVAEARNQYACLICRDYLAGLLSVNEAHKLLYNICLENNCAEKSAIKDDRFYVWMYLSDSLDLVREGYGTLPRFKYLTEDNYEEIFNQEANKFIAKYY